MDVIQEALQDLSALKLVTWLSSVGIIFGGVIPYIPQYMDIKHTENADGFSCYVCLALLIANTLRILFWFGHPYELPLLVQSIIMNVIMLAMIHLCVKVQNRMQIIPGKNRVFTDFDLRFFWEWTNFTSYIEFMALFTAVMGGIMYAFLDSVVVVETTGFLAVFTEAMLGAPQFYRNLRNKSTVGMSKKMVLMWTLGDVFKTCYFIFRDAPLQFWVCGFLQVAIDIAILLQVLMYKIPIAVTMVLKGSEHTN